MTALIACAWLLILVAMLTGPRLDHLARLIVLSIGAVAAASALRFAPRKMMPLVLVAAAITIGGAGYYILKARV